MVGDNPWGDIGAIAVVSVVSGLLSERRRLGSHIPLPGCRVSFVCSLVSLVGAAITPLGLLLT